jgi:hypothetical protein
MSILYPLVGFALGLIGFWGIGISLFICLRNWSTNATGVILWALVGILSLATSVVGLQLIILGQ